MSAEPLDLERFVLAQAHGVYDQALSELRSGRKRSHWMWFVFPQIAGLGHSATARLYALGSLEEARAYLAHPVLGPRLDDAVEATLRLPGPNARALFGSPDDMKFRSSLTLFAEAAPDDEAFGEALEKYFASQADPLTLEILAAQ